MNTTTQSMQHPAHVSAFKWIASGSVMAAFVSIAIIALAIVGLAGVFSQTMAAIATIIAAAALLIEGGALEAASKLREGQNSAMDWSAEAIGAVAGIVLGILALLGIASVTLVSVALLVFGVTLFLGGFRLADGGWMAGFADSELLLGLGAMVLGLLAVIGINPLTLVLVGLVVLGAAGLFCGPTRGFKSLQGIGES